MRSRLTSGRGSFRLRPVLVTLVGAALAVTAFGAVGYASPLETAAQAQYAPQNTAPPVISGTPRVGQTLTTSNGTFTGDQPITYSYQWQRCDTNGANCSNIIGATGQTYQLTTADQGRTIRAVVTATNARGATSSTSVPTAVVQAAQQPPPPPPPPPAGPAGQIRLPGGGISIPATSVELPARLVVDQVRFSPNPVRSRSANIRVRVRVRDTRGFFVRGALVFVRSTPLVTTAPPEQTTLTNGTATLFTRPRSQRGAFPLRSGYFVQFFVRARKPGDRPLAGVSTRRLVQLGTAQG